MSETLTDLARRYLLETCPLVGSEALRIIDAHAAERAEVVAQLEAVNGKLARAECLLLSAHPIVARSSDQGLRGAFNHHLSQRECGFDDLAGPPSNNHAALVAQVSELTRERDEARIANTGLRSGLASIESEVTLLTEALAAAEDRADSNAAVARDEIADAERTHGLLEADEARVRELEAKCTALGDAARRAEARVRELEAAHGMASATAQREARAHLETQERVEALEVLLAASEVRAAQWQADAESYRADATVARDRLATLQKRVANALEWLASDWTPQDNIRKAQEALCG